MHTGSRMHRVLPVPADLQQDDSAILFKEIAGLRRSASGTLSCRECLWLDHCELQKLAVELASRSGLLSDLTIDLSGRHWNIRENEEFAPRHFEVLRYANDLDFFSYLQRYFGERLRL